MFDRIRDRLFNKEVISYFIFGVLTTLVDWVSYLMLRQPAGYKMATILSQFFAILFAYVTNKIFVFENHDFHFRHLLREAASFFACRLFIAVFTYVAMVVMVDGLGIRQDILCKVVVSAISLILNYVFSKLVIFRKKSSEKS